LIKLSEEEGVDEDEERKRLIRVEDYSKIEIEEDMNATDWEFAYKEVLKLEEEKTLEKQREAERLI
jgi:hypothetical protein